jgi:histone H3/H4
MAKKKAAGGGKKGGRETFVVASKVKAFVRGKNLMASKELPDALSDAVSKLLDEAVVRCEKNGRRTVRPHDL